MPKLTKTQIEVVTKVPGYTLELSQIEALALLAVLDRVGGNPCSSLRGKTEGIRAQIDKEFSGAEYSDLLELVAEDGHTDAIYFKDGSIEVANQMIAELNSQEQ